MFGEILQFIANRSKKFGWFDDRPEWNISKQYSKRKELWRSILGGSWRGRCLNSIPEVNLE